MGTITNDTNMLMGTGFFFCCEGDDINACQQQVNMSKHLPASDECSKYYSTDVDNDGKKLDKAICKLPPREDKPGEYYKEITVPSELNNAYQGTLNAALGFSTSVAAFLEKNITAKRVDTVDSAGPYPTGASYFHYGLSLVMDPKGRISFFDAGKSYKKGTLYLYVEFGDVEKNDTIDNVSIYAGRSPEVIKEKYCDEGAETFNITFAAGSDNLENTFGKSINLLSWAVGKRFSVEQDLRARD